MLKKSIPGFPGYYADRMGGIWSTKKWNDKKPIRKLKPIKGKRGYFFVNLFKNKIMYPNRKISVLVLKTFVGPCPPGMEACHNDGIKAHNELDNLRWDTHQNNMLDSVKHGTLFHTLGEANGNTKLTNSDIMEIRKLLKSGEITQPELAKLYDVSLLTINRINTRKFWSHL